MQLPPGFTEFFERRAVLRSIVYALGGTALCILLVLASVHSFIRANTPELAWSSDLFALNRPAAYIFVDAEGATIGHRGAMVGERLTLADMPDFLPAAFLSVEDRRFYDHRGVDLRGLARAALVDIKAGKFVQGGSTITQQLAKILFLTPERTLSRKFQEIGAALELERKLPKDRILELYLNRIYLGSGAYGVDGAAQIYFGKSAREVSLSEAAMLAALTRAPSTFSPRRDLKSAQDRAAIVLAAMVETGFITEASAAAARKAPAKITDRTREAARNYFFDEAAAEAKRLVNREGDLIIVATLDPKMQDQALDALTSILKKDGPAVSATQGALAAMTKDGRVRALVGGMDYLDSPFNRASDANRQPGSAFKPFVYLAALESGMSPHTLRYDDPVDINGYAPENFGGAQWGEVTLSEALSRSINRVAVELGKEIGPQRVITVAKRLGIVSKLEPNASLPLGTSEVTPLELTGAYAAFASEGMRAKPTMVEEIRTSDGNVIYRRPSAAPERVIKEREALAMNAMMYEVVQSGTARAAQVPGFEIAGKTGTSSNFRDAWFVGYSSDLVTGVWVGNDDATPMKKVTGGALPARIFSRFMTAALKGATPVKLARDFPEPEGSSWITGWRDESEWSGQDQWSDQSGFRDDPRADDPVATPRGRRDDRPQRQARARVYPDENIWTEADERAARAERDRYITRNLNRTERDWRRGRSDDRDDYRDEEIYRDPNGREYRRGNPDDDGLPPYAMQRRDGYWIPVPDYYGR